MRIDGRAVARVIAARVVVPVVAGLLVLTGCVDSTTAEGIPTKAPESSDARLDADALDPCSRPNMTTVEPGAVTFATTDVPAPPFFLTDEPADRVGLEADLAYTLAEQMGFRAQEVTWEFVRPDDIVTGQFLDYDIAIGGFTDRSEQFPAVAFTRPYLEVPLELVTTAEDASAVFTGVRAAGEDPGQRRTPDQLSWAATFQGPGPPWLIGQGWMDVDTRYEWARGGTSVETALSLADVVVVDEPTRRWLQEVGEADFTRVRGVEAPQAAFAMATVAGNPLLACIDRALGEMSEDGVLADLSDRWTDPTSWIQD